MRRMIPLTTRLSRSRRAAAALAFLLTTVSTPGAASNASAAFKAENDAAMQRMMVGMDLTPSGDVDRDFAEMMIAHHQGAIDMAEAELRHGRNEQLRRIAQEIIVSQQQEIAIMRLALGDPPPASAPAPTQPLPKPPADPEHQHP